MAVGKRNKGRAEKFTLIEWLAELRALIIFQNLELIFQKTKELQARSM